LKTRSTRTPAQVFSPGEYIRDELEARGWTQENLAQIMGRPQAAINLIINDKRGITPETAVELGGAFGTTPDFWLNLDAMHKLSRVSETVKVEEIRRRAALFDASAMEIATGSRRHQTTAQRKSGKAAARIAKS